MNLHKFCGKKLCVATSGGVDSTALLHFLKSMETECGYSLCAVHCEHGIRGEESVEDMRFVQALCEKWNVPLFTFSQNCPDRAKREKVSLETAARNFRMECFSELVREGKADFIATAHHLQDEAETVLFRLARGASLSGARGMDEENGFLIRPFLDWRKQKIFSYAQEHGLEYREDRTNYETDATRNKLRWTVLPALENAVPGAAGNLARFAAIAAEDDAYLYAQSQTLLFRENGGVGVAFCEEKPLFRRACLTAIKETGLERDYTAAHLQALFTLQSAERGATLHLPKGVRAEKTLSGIFFFTANQTGRQTLDCVREQASLPQALPFTENGFDGGRYAVKICSTLPKSPKGGTAPWKILRADGDKIPSDAVFRFRREGDEMQKFGGGTQSLKKFFNDKKIPPRERAFLPLIASGESGEVYAVCGVEIAERLKITENTQRVFYIILQKK